MISTLTGKISNFWFKSTNFLLSPYKKLTSNQATLQIYEATKFIQNLQIPTSLKEESC